MGPWTPGSPLDPVSPFCPGLPSGPKKYEILYYNFVNELLKYIFKVRQVWYIS